MEAEAAGEGEKLDDGGISRKFGIKMDAEAVKQLRMVLEWVLNGS